MARQKHGLKAGSCCCQAPGHLLPRKRARVRLNGAASKTVGPEKRPQRFESSRFRHSLLRANRPRQLKACPCWQAHRFSNSPAAQWTERRPPKPEVARSTRAGRARFSRCSSDGLEHDATNVGVGSSSLSGEAKHHIFYGAWPSPAHSAAFGMRRSQVQILPPRPRWKVGRAAIAADC